ncbi:MULTISPECIES: hypothetical protein [Pandoraea]|uniref:Uncharacterized protein n=2 Tax=Pandoraea TaxID=93217 RepID=A0A5E4XIG4_9BURK|nr:MULTISPECIES: hypothetical protein [Pandoraea]VVE18367.1 hypothetical protein PCE31107_03016 [Pandoraea cepalis]VVE36161.1 hypothetical protein PTE31013_03937 [Pandoraea terrigena]
MKRLQAASAPAPIPALPDRDQACEAINEAHHDGRNALFASHRSRTALWHAQALSEWAIRATTSAALTASQHDRAIARVGGARRKPAKPNCYAGSLGRGPAGEARRITLIGQRMDGDI